MPIYAETQQRKYRYFICGFIIAFQVAATLYALHLVELMSLYTVIPVLVISPLILFAGYGLVFFQRLDTRIDDEGVHYRAPFRWNKWHTISWPEIDQIYVREYALIGEYPKGILGLRQGPNGFAIAPQYGLFGLQIEKKSGGKYLLGTHRPDELTQFLMNRSAQKPVSLA